MLLDVGADPNVPGRHGQTPLMAAASEGNTEIFENLLEQRADFKAKDDEGSTAFLKAAEQGSIDILRILLELGVDINQRDNDGNTALILCASNGKEDALRFLLDKGADATIKNEDDKSALVCAMESGYKEIVEILSEFSGEEVDMISGFKKLKLAIKAGNIEMVKQCATFQNINGNSFGQKTALMKAVQKRQYEIVKILLENGALVNETDWYDKSALDYALDRWLVDPQIIDLLLVYGATVKKEHLSCKSANNNQNLLKTLTRAMEQQGDNKSLKQLELTCSEQESIPDDALKTLIEIGVPHYGAQVLIAKNKIASLTKVYDTTEDEPSGLQFHSSVDNKGPLLFIVRNGDRFSGGFTFQPWKSCNHHIKDNKAFLFTIVPSYRVYASQNENYSFLDEKEAGPGFGSNGEDMNISFNPLQMSVTTMQQTYRLNLFESLALGFKNAKSPVRQGIFKAMPKRMVYKGQIDRLVVFCFTKANKDGDFMAKKQSELPETLQSAHAMTMLRVASSDTIGDSLSLSIGEPIKEGYLTKRGHIVKTWKRRWFKLTNTELIYYENHSTNNKKEAIDLKNAEIKRVNTFKEKDKCFRITSHSGKEYFIQCGSDIELEEWMTAIQDVIDGKVRIAPNTPFTLSRKAELASSAFSAATCETPPLRPQSVCSQSSSQTTSSTEAKQASAQSTPSSPASTPSSPLIRATQVIQTENLSSSSPSLPSPLVHPNTSPSKIQKSVALPQITQKKTSPEGRLLSPQQRQETPSPLQPQQARMSPLPPSCSPTMAASQPTIQLAQQRQRQQQQQQRLPPQPKQKRTWRYSMHPQQMQHWQHDQFEPAQPSHSRILSEQDALCNIDNNELHPPAVKVLSSRTNKPLYSHYGTVSDTNIRSLQQCFQQHKRSAQQGNCTPPASGQGQQMPSSGRQEQRRPLPPNLNVSPSSGSTAFYQRQHSATVVNRPLPSLQQVPYREPRRPTCNNQSNQ